MREIHFGITLNSVTFEIVPGINIRNDNRTFTKLTVSDQIRKRFVTGKEIQLLRTINQVLKDNNLASMIQEEIEYVKNQPCSKLFSFTYPQTIIGI